MTSEPHILDFFKFLFDKKRQVPPMKILHQLINTSEQKLSFLADIFKYPEILYTFKDFLEIEDLHDEFMEENPRLVFYFDIPKKFIDVYSNKIIFKELVKGLKKNEYIEDMYIGSTSDYISIEGAYVLRPLNVLQKARWA